MLRRYMVYFTLLFAPWPVAAQVISQYKIVTTVDVLTTQLNGLANNAFSAASSAVDNRPGGAGDASLLCEFELNTAYGTIATPAAPAVGTSTVWLLRCQDDTNCENTPTASVRLGRRADISLPVTTGQAATRVVQEVRCPPGQFKVVLLNDQTGLAMKESGNTLRVRFLKIEGE